MHVLVQAAYLYDRLDHLGHPYCFVELFLRGIRVKDVVESGIFICPHSFIESTIAHALGHS